MPDSPLPHRTDPTLVDRSIPGPLTPDRIEAILADFRDWLEGLSEHPEPEGEAGEVPIDLGTLVEQFTALRHEVHLQTRATRSVNEQLAEALKAFGSKSVLPDATETLRPLVSVLLEVADALSVSLQQVERSRESAQAIVGELAAPARSGWLSRLVGRATDASDCRSESADRLQRLLTGIADGYALSLRRVQRALAVQEIVPFLVVGLPFDPERMEAIERVAVPGQNSGTVVEEVRSGYVWNGELLRVAQVKVAS